MFSACSIRFITRAVLTLGLVVGCLVGSPVGFAQTPADGQGKVKIEWLGHEFYRLTSPKGVVVITSPWLANPDGPVPLESLARTAADSRAQGQYAVGRKVQLGHRARLSTALWP